MKEEIKDPNQLDMFAGILLTVEQEQMVAAHIKRRKESTDAMEAKSNTLMNILLKNGFEIGTDFVNTFKREMITKELTLGYSHNNTQFTSEITFETYSGEVGFKVLQFWDGQLREFIASVSIEGGKLNSYTIQQNNRSIKPSTMLEKLRLFNLRSKNRYEDHLKRINVKQHTIDKYQTKYPNATVTVEKTWSKHHGDYELIVVKFPSGSYIKFRFYDTSDKEWVYEIRDEELKRLSTEEVLEKFNKQEALN